MYNVLYISFCDRQRTETNGVEAELKVQNVQCIFYSATDREQRLMKLKVQNVQCTFCTIHMYNVYLL